MSASSVQNQSKQETRILLAEDNSGVREMVKEILSRNGYEVVATTDGRQAYDYYQAHSDRIDLVLTDIVMPEMDGKELSQLCRKMSPQVSILFMSGYLDSQLNPEEDLVGNADFLAKPFRPAELLQKVEALVEAANC